MGMRLARALPEAKSSARLNLILNAHWNKGLSENSKGRCFRGKGWMERV